MYRYFIFFCCLLLTGTAAADDANRRFLDEHWQRPLAPQGEPPASFSALEAALDPASCGTCHTAQLADWKDSRHAHAMDPGVLGQLLDMDAEDRASHQECLRCHAPLAEQADGLVAELKAGEEQDASGLPRQHVTDEASRLPEAVPGSRSRTEGLRPTASRLHRRHVTGEASRLREAVPGSRSRTEGLRPTASRLHRQHVTDEASQLPEAVPGSRSRTEGLRPTASRLHRHGMMCAACHVRGHQRYGPPRRDGSQPQADEGLPHGGFKVAPAFSDARFCASCHQFPQDGYALNGKLLENTLEEWKASRYAREGRTCQSCHMPDRRHLWRGIHDPEMVRSGVTIQSSAATAKGRARASLTVRNTGTGHYFPTYATPMVELEIFQEDRAGKAIAGTLKRSAIGRNVSLDITREIFDTRLAPDAQHVMNYDFRLSPLAVAVVVRVRVEPDAFYARFYRSMLTQGLPDKGLTLMRKALHDASRSGFELYMERYPVKR